MNLSLETQQLINGTYQNAVNFLKQKYGIVNGSYFLTTTCATPNSKIKRTKDGLVIHHVKENVAGDLSKKEQALQYPFSYQESNNLVYCNYIEHLILHILILKESNADIFNGEKILGIGGVIHILRFLYTCKKGQIPTLPWQLNCYNAVKDKLNEVDILYRRCERVWDEELIYCTVLGKFKTLMPEDICF